jgi:Tol biopolymer transport system component
MCPERRMVGPMILALSLLGARAGFAAGSVELLHQSDPSPISATASGDLYTSSFPLPAPVSISADGRYAVFLSGATNLVSGQQDFNGPPGYPGKDVFLADLTAGTVTLVTHAMGLPATAGNLGSSAAVISADGRWIAFLSSATDLVPGQVDNFPFIAEDQDLLLYDRVTATTTLVASTLQEETSFFNLRISADGRFVGFGSDAGDLIPGEQSGGSYDVYLYDRTVGSTRLVSHLPGAPLNGPEDGAFGPTGMSADGRYLVFGSSAADLVPGQISTASALLYDRVADTLRVIGPADDADISADGKIVALSLSASLYLWARDTGATTLVDTLTPGTALGHRAFSLSGDGRYLAYLSLAPPFGVTSPWPQVYDRIAGTSKPVSRASTAPPANAEVPGISGDGRFVVFASSDPGWIAGQTGTQGGIFIYDRAADRTSLASHTPASLTTLANGESYAPAISADGTRAVYDSQATNLAAGILDLNGTGDTFAYDVSSATNRAVTLRAPDLPPLAPAGESRASAVSADGRYVAFERAATALDAYLGQIDVLIYDTVARTTQLVDHVRASATTAARGASFEPVFSGDGRTVAFYSNSRTLVPGANPGGVYCLFLFDRVAGAVTFVARTDFDYGAEDERELPRPSLGADGRWVAFASYARDLVPGQQEQDPDPFDKSYNVFLFDRTSGAIKLASHSTAGGAVTGDQASYDPVLSADGRYLAFLSGASDLIAGESPDGSDGSPGAYLYDRVTGGLTLLSHSRDTPLLVESVLTSLAMSADGRYLAFGTVAGDLDPNVPSVGPTLYIYDRVAASYQRVTYASYAGLSLALSADGRILATYGFNSSLSFYDRVTRTMSAIPGVEVDDGELALSGNGRYVAFATDAPNLAPGLIRLLGWDRTDVYLLDRTTGTAILVNQWQGSAVTSQGFADAPVISADGRRVAFTSLIDLVPGDYNRQSDAYLFSLDAGTPGGPVTVPPCILLDTRRPADGPALRSNAARVVKAAGACGVPEAATKVSVKVTTFQGTGQGNVRFYPGDLSAPSTGILRFTRGQTRAASFDLPLAPNAGTMTLLPFVAGNGTVGVSVEIDGYTP